MKKKIYLVISHYTKPKFKESSRVAGWMNSQGLVQHDEELAVKTRIKNSDLTQSSIILDLTESKVVMSKFGDRDYAKLLDYALKHYQSYIVKACNEYGVHIEGITNNGTIPTET